MGMAAGWGRPRLARKPARILLLLAVLAWLALPSVPAAAGVNVFTVNSTADPGTGGCDVTECTLREAIAAANSTANDPAGPDEIHFSIAGSGPHTIAPTSSLPGINQPVVIDGSTEPDEVQLDGSSAGNTSGLVIAASAGGSRITELSIFDFTIRGIDVISSGNVVEDCFVGTDASGTSGKGNGENGIGIFGDGNVVRGSVVSGNGVNGIFINAGDDNVVAGNKIGTNPAGTADLGNTFAGVRVAFGADDNTIGGSTAADRNVISGNDQQGVNIGSNQQDPVTGTTVLRNYIGTKSNGNEPLGNAIGLFLQGNARQNALRGNVISANNIGVALQDDGNQPGGTHGPSANVMAGNLIGTTADGLGPLGNAQFGIVLGSPFGHPLVGNSIGGTAGLTPGGDCTGDCNVVGDNAAGGISIAGMSTGTLVQGNHIGVDASGAVSLPNVGPGVELDGSSANRIGGSGAGNVIANNNGDGVQIIGTASENPILGNSIHDNTGLGIDLSNDGISGNDLGDGDTGPNGLQNFPELVSAVAGSSTYVGGFYDSTPNTRVRLEFFANASADPSGNGEGEIFLGAKNVKTNGIGVAPFAATLPGTADPGDEVSATATRLTSKGKARDTSEFAATVTEGCTVTGTPGDDPNLTGTSGPDVFCALEGDDVVVADAGDDVVVGGPGADLVDYSGTPGKVTADLGSGLVTEAGATTDFLFGVEDLAGTSFGDTLKGNGGKNTIEGGSGKDTLKGRGKNDRLFGEGGNDVLHGGSGNNDYCDGGPGNDTAKACERRKSI